MGKLGAIVRSLVLCGAGLAVACSLVTHAYDYQAGDLPIACGACAGHPAYARAPCGADGGTGSEDAMTPTIYFRVDSVSFGADAGYAVGLSQDCAERDGAPSCIPTKPPVVPFPSPANGVENAFGSNVLGPMLRYFPAASDVETEVNAWIKAELGGFVVVIDGWNGLADDTAVRVRLASVLRGGSAPVFDNVNPSSIAASVTANKLVARFDPGQLVLLPLGNTTGALVSVNAFGLVITGELADDGKTIDPLVIAAYLESGGQLGTDFEHHVAELVLGCVDGGVQAGTARVSELVPAAFDLAAPPSRTCNLMSFGLAARASRVDIQPTLSRDGRGSCAASLPDASTPDADATTGDAMSGDAPLD